MSGESYQEDFMNQNITSWQSYEEVATYLLNELSEYFQLDRVERKQLVDSLNSGTAWEIDAKGVKEGNTGFVVIEVRRLPHTRLCQKELAAMAFTIQDTGAVGGIIVSPLPLQRGAELIARYSNIIAVQLHENSTVMHFVLRFLNNVMLSYSPESVIVNIPAIVEISLTKVVGNSNDA